MVCKVDFVEVIFLCVFVVGGGGGEGVFSLCGVDISSSLVRSSASCLICLDCCLVVLSACVLDVVDVFLFCKSFV